MPEENTDVSEEICGKQKKEAKCLPNKTLTFKDDKCFRGKHSWERITVLLCVNMIDDEKIKPHIIGKVKTRNTSKVQNF